MRSVFVDRSNIATSFQVDMEPYTQTGAPPQLIWLVTGCSGGCGLALVKHLISQNQKVIATSRNPAKSPEAVQQITSHPNGRWIALDVTWDIEKIQTTLDDVLQGFGNSNGGDKSKGKIDVLVNNAAFSVLGAIEDIPEQAARSEFDTNVWGVWRMTRAILPQMRNQRSGVIVNISSLLGVTSWPVCGIYSASKFAIEGFSQALALEVAPFSVKVMLVNFGSFRTNFLAEGSAQMVEPSGPYSGEHPVKKALEEEQRKDGPQPGDPKKAAARIFETVIAAATESGGGNVDSGVRRLVLGSDCLDMGMQQVKTLHEQFAASKETARSTSM